MRLPENFDREVCAVAAQIPHGRVATYGQLARLIGFPAHARRVGRALAAAPPEIPCHRVVDSRGGTSPHGRDNGSCWRRRGSASAETAGST